MSDEPGVFTELSSRQVSMEVQGAGEPGMIAAASVVERELQTPLCRADKRRLEQIVHHQGTPLTQYGA